MKTLPAIARRERGVVLIMYALLLTLLLAFSGLVIDLGLVYLRRARMQALADISAIGAALKLNGTNAGVSAAVAEAMNRVAKFKVSGLDREDVRAAVRFSANPYSEEKDWLAEADITGDATGETASAMRYARIDFGALPEAARMMQPVFAGAMGNVQAFDVRPAAVAGPMSLNVMPLAICARDSNPNFIRLNGSGKVVPTEKIAYGFRQGVTYNLLMLNPHGNKPVYYYVDPLTLGSGQGKAAEVTDAVLAPFICSGRVGYTVIGNRFLKLTPKPVTGVSFNLWKQLNSRFNQYDATAGVPSCTRSGTPPDLNIKSYQNAAWQAASMQVSASPAMVNGGLATIADRPWSEFTQTNMPDSTEYGTRWAFRSPRDAAEIKYTASWNVLYPSKSSVTAPFGNWQQTGPYNHPSASYNSPYFVKPATVTAAEPAYRGRRLMHIPLLQCPVDLATNQARVLAYGIFLLSAPASKDEVPAEFGGVVRLAEEGSLAGNVELFR